jgi:hypothetical protein
MQYFIFNYNSFIFSLEILELVFIDRLRYYMDNMEIWKKERISVLNTLLINKDYILLRGAKSWNINSDIDVLCPTFEQG